MKKVFTTVLIILVFALTLFCCSCVKQNENKILSITPVEGTFKTVYTVGDSIDLTNSQIQVTYSDGTVMTVDVTIDMIDPGSFSTAFPANRKTLKINYSNFVCNLYYTVKDKEIQHTIKNVYLENMPETFLSGEPLPIENGLLKDALLCIKLEDDNIFKYPIKGIWIKNFSTAATGEHTATIEYESDYGPVSTEWKYYVNSLSSIKEVVYDWQVEVYQNDGESELIKQLTDKTFTVKYSDGSEKDYNYNANFKISGFSSNDLGSKSCSISFVDNENRTVRFTLNYIVKEVYPEYEVNFDLNYDNLSPISIKTIDGKITPPKVERPGYQTSGWYLWDGSTLSSEPFNFNSIIESDITLRPRWQRLSYTIKIYSFGVLIREESYNVETVRPLEPPTDIDGYTFSHYADEQNNTIASIAKGTTGDLILHCVWIADGYKINYDLADSTSPYKAENTNPTTYTKDDPLTFVEPTRNGYDFNGWFYNGNPITTTEGLSKDITVVAKWTIAEYSLNLYNAITNDLIKSITFKITDTDTIIDDYDSEDYFFLGWFVDKEFSNEFTKDSNHRYYLKSGSWGNINLYAKLENKYTLILDGNNNSELKYFYFKDTDSTISLPTPEKFGSDFTAWLGQSAFNNIRIDKDALSNFETTSLINIMNEQGSRKATLVATYNYHNWNITYHEYVDYSGNEVVSYDTYYTNQEKTLPVLSRNGYKFMGWYENSDFNGSAISVISAFSKDRNLELTAKWQSIVYSITVDARFTNCNEQNIPTTYTANDEISLPILSYPEYVFLGWYLDQYFEIPQSNTIQKGTYGNLTLYAKWQPVNITMKLNNMIAGARYGGSTSYNVESGVVELLPATKDGYNFLGWYLDSGLKNEVTSFKAEDYPSNRVFTAYAKWEAINYTITYVLNDNSTFKATNNNPTTATIEDKVTLSDASRIGYYFEGWYFTSDFTNSAVTQLNSVSSNTTLYARWRERIYNITYLNCDYEGVNTQNLQTTFKATSTGTTLTKLTRANYTFDGWFMGDEIITKVGVATIPETCDDLTLTAKWTAKPYTITFTANGKKATIQYTIEDFVDGVFTLPTLQSMIPDKFDEAVLKGREFLGWYKGSNTATLYTEIKSSEIANLSFTALTKYTEYNIIYILPDGSVNNENNPTTFTLQSTVLNIYSPNFDGLAFKGWYLDADYSTPAGTISSGITKVNTKDQDITLYAYFVDIYTITYNLLDGVTISSQPKTYSEAQSVAIANPTTSLNFGGWWWIENNSIVANTADFGNGGNVTLLPLVYDKSATQKLIFKLNSNSTATVMGISGNSTTLKIPTSVSGYQVTAIEDSAFSGNTYLQSVSIPESVTTIGYRAFANCSKITSLTVLGSARLNNQAFLECTALTTATINPTATFGDGVFEKCIALTTLSVGANKTILSYFGKTAYTGCTSKGGYYVPNSLTTVVIQGSPENINGIFTLCSFLKTVKIEGTSLTTFSTSDVNALSQGVTVQVDSSLLAEYKATYSQINFVELSN